MKALSINTVPQFIDKLWKTHESAFFFRGQSKDWPLVPSIARHKYLVRNYEDWPAFQKDVLNEYSKYAIQHLAQKPSNYADWLIQMQHFGLPTCLLDLTTSPLIALYFAVSEEEYDSLDGVLWAISTREHHEDFVDTRNFDTDSFRFLRPRQANQRLIAQQGSFAMFPLPKNCKQIVSMDKSDEATKIIEKTQKWKIPADKKSKIRIELALLGIRPRTIYPDLHGAAEDIKFQLMTGGWIS